MRLFVCLGVLYTVRERERERREEREEREKS